MEIQPGGSPLHWLRDGVHPAYLFLEIYSPDDAHAHKVYLGLLGKETGMLTHEELSPTPPHPTPPHLTRLTLKTKGINRHYQGERISWTGIHLLHWVKHTLPIVLPIPLILQNNNQHVPYLQRLTAESLWVHL